MATDLYGSEYAGTYTTQPVYFKIGPPETRWEVASVKISWKISKTIYYSGGGTIP